MNDSLEIQTLVSTIVHTLKKEQDGRLGLKTALKLIQRAEEKAIQIGVPMVISVVDEGGNLIAFLGSFCFQASGRFSADSEAALARKVDGRVEEALFAAAVKARAFEAVREGRHGFERRGDAVGELNLAADPGGGEQKRGVKAQ